MRSLSRSTISQENYTVELVTVPTVPREQIAVGFLAVSCVVHHMRDCRLHPTTLSVLYWLLAQHAGPFIGLARFSRSLDNMTSIRSDAVYGGEDMILPTNLSPLSIYKICSTVLYHVLVILSQIWRTAFIFPSSTCVKRDVCGNHVGLLQENSSTSF